jgi:hypothetical protein
VEDPTQVFRLADADLERNRRTAIDAEEANA